MLEQHGLDSPYSNGSGPKSSFFKTFPNLHVFAGREITYLTSGWFWKSLIFQESHNQHESCDLRQQKLSLTNIPALI